MLALLPHFPFMHFVFHVFMLQKYMSNKSYVIALDSMELGPYLIFGEELIVILDRHVRILRIKEIASINVQ